MALSRKLLKGMGLSDEQVDSIIDAHTETVESLKAERDTYKGDAEKLPGVQKQLDDLKAETDGGKGKYKAMYEAEHEELEKLRADIASKETAAAKDKALRTMLAEIGVPDKFLDIAVRATDFNALSLDSDGKFEGEAALRKSLKTDFGSFIPVAHDEQHKPDTPMNNIGGVKMTKEDIYKKDEHGRYVLSAAERQKALVENSKT